MTADREITAEDIRTAFLGGAAEIVATPPARSRPDKVDRAESMRAARREWLKRPPQERPLSPKWYMIMTLQLRGHTAAEIAKRVGCHSTTVTNISNSPRYRAALEARLKDLDNDLLVLKPKAIDALSSALVDPNKDTALRAARTYFEMTGQGTFGKGVQDAGSTGAVALAKALLAEARATAEVHIHVGGSSEVPSDSVLVGRTRETDPVRSLHTEPSGGLLPGPQGDFGADAPAGDPDRSQSHGVEGDSREDGREEYLHSPLCY